MLNKEGTVLNICLKIEKLFESHENTHTGILS